MRVIPLQKKKKKRV